MPILVVGPVVAVTALMMVAAGCSGPGSKTPVDASVARAGADADTEASAPIEPRDSGDLDTDARIAQTPTPPGFIHSEGALALALGAPDLAEIEDGLGYALVPTALPPGFELAMAELVAIPSSPLATVFYESEGRRISLFYPADFIPEFGRETDRPGIFAPPPDAVVRVVVDGELAYLMRGEWDEDTIQLLASYTAQWEYNGRLTLYFEYQPESGEREWAMLSANTQRVDWIGVGGLIDIAESAVATR